MRRYNVVGVLSPDGESWLLCLRAKPPYQGKYNLVGGKIEPGEESEAAAYRALWEETGIERAQIDLAHVMDFTYYRSGCSMEFWAGRLKEAVVLREETNPLRWFSLKENFFDGSRFAGMGNIGHMLEELRDCGLAD